MLHSFRTGNQVKEKNIFMINEIAKNLERGIQLLNSITDSEYSDETLPPYFSSIGCNIRHVLDAFTAIIKGFESGHVDFTDRKRNTICEKETKEGIRYIEETIRKLHGIKKEDFSKIISVTDNLGNGDITINYTLESTFGLCALACNSSFCKCWIFGSSTRNRIARCRFLDTILPHPKSNI